MLLRLSKKLNGNFFLGLFILLIIPFRSAIADAPFLTDSAVTMDPLQWYAILYSAADKSKIVTSVVAPGLEYDIGLAPGIELDTYTPVVTNLNPEPLLRTVFAKTTGPGDIDVELKFRLHKETKYLPILSFAPNVYLPTGNANRGLGNGRAWYYFPLIVQKKIESWTTYAEAAYIINHAPGLHNHFFAGWVLQKNLSNKITLGGEIFTETRSSFYSPAYTLLNLGGYYNFTKNTSLLASVGHSILGQEHWFAYFGIAWS